MTTKTAPGSGYIDDLLVKANMDAEKEDRLDEEELIGQMR